MLCAELLCPQCTPLAAPGGAKKKRFKSTILSPDTDKLLLDYIGQLKSIISELTARNPLLSNITDNAEFVKSFSKLSVDDQNASDPEEHLIRWRIPNKRSSVISIIFTRVYTELTRGVKLNCTLC